jgi:signal transduction histidine kinase
MQKQGLDTNRQKVFLGKAYESLSEIENDSLRNKILYEISYQYYKLKDSINFRETNTKARELSLMLQDSNIVGMTYWDLAEFYYDYNMADSAYYYYHKSQKIYASLENNYRSARLLLNMAIIQKNIKDYTGSEVTTTQAISLLEPLNKYKHLYRAYNNLGILYNELEEYEKSLSYYKTAEEYLKEAGKEDLYPSIWNNIGVMYKKSGQYKKATRYFVMALSHDEQLHNTDPELYAMLLDNQAHNRFQSGGTTGILPQFNKALAIREKHDIVPGVIVSKLHLAEYYLRAKDTVSAIRYASHAKELAKESLNGRDLLASLMLLSKTSKDNSFYTRKYIHINDSLQRRERVTRNKFARIRYETAGYIEQNERLTERISKISLIGITGGIILILLVVIQRQRSKNKELVLIQEKQKQFEEGREKEKHRISQELHDGVLAKLFGATMSLESLNDEDHAEAKQKRVKRIEQIKDISEEIRLLSHELSETSLTGVDFAMVLQEFIDQQDQNQTKFQLKINPAIKWNNINDDIKVNLYRIMQEAVQNIHKHAMATKVVISFGMKNHKLIFDIKDNGKGLVQGNAPTGIGLKNIRERVKSLNGDLKIITGDKGEGTLLNITIPLNTRNTMPWRKKK